MSLSLELALTVEKLVLTSLTAALRGYVNVRAHPEAVRSSLRARGGADWSSRAPSPCRVFVFTEFWGGGYDPMDDGRVHRAFEDAVRRLKRIRGITDAGWESYSVAVAYFWVEVAPSLGTC